jgi:hypothetical protein
VHTCTTPALSRSVLVKWDMRVCPLTNACAVAFTGETFWQRRAKTERALDADTRAAAPPAAATPVNAPAATPISAPAATPVNAAAATPVNAAAVTPVNAPRPRRPPRLLAPRGTDTQAVVEAAAPSAATPAVALATASLDWRTASLDWRAITRALDMEDPTQPDTHMYRVILAPSADSQTVVLRLPCRCGCCAGRVHTCTTPALSRSVLVKWDMRVCPLTNACAVAFTGETFWQRRAEARGTGAAGEVAPASLNAPRARRPQRLLAPAPTRPRRPPRLLAPTPPFIIAPTAAPTPAPTRHSSAAAPAAPPSTPPSPPPHPPFLLAAPAAAIAPADSNVAPAPADSDVAPAPAISLLAAPAAATSPADSDVAPAPADSR